MSDVRIRLDPPAERATWEVERDVVPEIERLGLNVEGPEPPIEERSAIPHEMVPVIILLTIKLAASAIRDIDDIVEIVSKWANNRREGQSKRVVKLYGPDDEVLREIESDD